ncbi:histamine N-methyltransferase-like [Ptychodera flava]|uniref:histamine N-methyltransferase-like n=1 Tax=Ptychodera flava TaxID=63121 RepID=UPI00396A48AE
MTSGEYRKSYRDKKTKFDLIHMIQMLYYVDDVEETIRGFYENYLKQNGCLLIIIASDNWNKFNKTFYQQPVYLNNLVTAEDIVEILHRRHIDCTTFKLPSQVEIDECLKKSKIGSVILDMITECEDFMNSAPADLFDDVMTYMKTDGSVANNGNVMFKNDLQAIVIRKY